MCSAVIDMTLNKKYIKYILNVILYVFACTLCYVLRYNYFVANELKLTNDTSDKRFSFIHNSNKQLMKRNEEMFKIDIKKMEYNDMKSRFIREQNNSYLQSISETCTRYNPSTTLMKRHYFYSPKKTSLYCWIRKIASTSFTKIFSDIRKRRVLKDYYKETDILSPKSIEELKSLVNNNQVFKFLIVRHPFERIVSSYRDRMEDNTKYTAQSWIYVPRIFHLTRPELFYSNTATGNSLSRIFDNNRRLKLIPTFKEFITWLLLQPTSNDDVHWDSYYSHCSICDINYNFIMKLENHSLGGLDFIFSKMGLSKNEIDTPKLEKTRGGFTDYNKTCSYFKTLTQDMILKLYQRYKIDFEMFNYTYENYIQCADSKLS